jgi:hypothetical protein
MTPAEAIELLTAVGWHSGSSAKPAVKKALGKCTLIEYNTALRPMEKKLSAKAYTKIKETASKLRRNYKNRLYQAKSRMNVRVVPSVCIDHPVHAMHERQLDARSVGGWKSWHAKSFQWGRVTLEF